MTAEEHHKAALQARHAALESKIHEEETRPHPDDIKLHELKRQKLKIRDELSGHMQ